MATTLRSKSLDSILRLLAITKSKLSVYGLTKTFQRNLLLSIGGVFLLFAVCFSVYQYQREK